jgi:hypothetical protein
MNQPHSRSESRQKPLPSLPELKARLQSLKAPIDRDIRNYPGPIAGCDAQFNYLLEERAKLSRELVRLEKLSRHENAAHEAEIAAFIESSEYLTAP